MKLCVFVLFLFLVLPSVHSRIIEFKNQPLVEQPSLSQIYERIYFLRIGMYDYPDAKKDLSLDPFYLFSADKSSLVKFNLQFRKLAQEKESGYIQLFLLYSSDYLLLQQGGNPLFQFQKYNQALCSRKSTVEDTTKQLQTVLKDRFFYQALELKEEDMSVDLNYEYEVTKSGMYYIVIHFCPLHMANEGVSAAHSHDVVFDGSIVYHNPYGHLDAEVFSYLPFYATISVIYLLVAIIWFIQNCCYWKYISNIQVILSIVLFISMLEAGMYFAHFYEWNLYGVRNTFLTSSSLFLTLIRRCLFRILIILISFGYGTHRDFIGQDNWTQILLYIFFFLFANLVSQFLFVILGVNSNENMLNYTSYEFTTAISDVIMYVILSLPLWIVELAFLLWVFRNSYILMRDDQFKRATAKIALLNRLKYVLGFYAAGALGWTIYEYFYRIFVLEFLFQQFYTRDSQWETNWALDAVWTILFVVVLLLLLIVYRVSSAKWQELKDHPSNGVVDHSAINSASQQRRRVVDPEQHLIERPVQQSEKEIELEIQNNQLELIDEDPIEEESQKKKKKRAKDVKQTLRDADMRPVQISKTNSSSSSRQPKSAMTGFSLVEDDDEDEQQ